MRREAALLALLTGCATAPPPTAPAARELVLSVVGTSDLHGRLGMLPWLGGHLRALRAARDGAVLLVDAGDMFQGTIASNLDEGATVVAAYNALGYAAAAVGNHEFDYGPEGPATFATRPEDDPRGALRARAREARFPFLAANLAEGDRAPAWENVRPSALVTVAGVRVGVVGVSTIATGETTLAANFRGLAMRPLADAIAREAAALRARGAVAVVVLAHAGGACRRFDDPRDATSCEAREEIMDVARALPAGAADLVVGGHTHQAVAHFVQGVPVIQSYANGRAMGRADLVIDRAAGRVREVRLFAPRALCEGQRSEPDPDRCAPAPYEGAAVTPDPEVARVIAPALARAEQARARAVGVTLAGTMDASYDRESPLPNLVADAMRAASPGADVALMNHGGVRVDLRAGALTYGALYSALPFDNRLVRVRMRGAALRAAVAQNAAGDGGALAVSGVRASLRCEGGRAAVTLTRDDGRAVRDDESLAVVTNDYLATSALRAHLDAPLTDHEALHAPMLRDAVAEALRAMGPTIRADDPRWFDRAAPRVALPGPRPVRCAR